jgi:hypothetical protein
LFTKAWKLVRPPTPSEVQVHISVIAHLRLRCRPGVIYFHVPNGEFRDKRDAAKLRAMGVRAGVADLIFIWNENPRVRILFLELKTAHRKPTPIQTEFRAEACGIGCDYECADGIDEALQVLERYAILPPTKIRLTVELGQP